MKGDDWALHAWSKWPQVNRIVPGGLLDCAGFDIPIVGLRNWSPIPVWLKPLDAIFGSFLLFRHYRVEFVYGEPRKLSLDEFKEKLCKLLHQQRASFVGSGISYQKCRTDVQRAATYKDALFATGNQPSAPPWGRPKAATIPGVRPGA